MQRGEVWWARLPAPAGMRPVLIISRDKAVQVRQAVTVAQITRTVRAIPTEVPLGRSDGMPKACVVNADVLLTVPKKLLSRRLCSLSPGKMGLVAEALRFALALS